MIEVIKHGKKKFTATCTNCGCEFTYEVEDIKLGSVTCPDCGDYVAHPNFGNNNGSLYYPPNCKDVKYPPDLRFFTTTDANKANTMGTLLGDVHTTEKDIAQSTNIRRY